MRFFPDSNFFFQFRDPRELDWSLVTKDNDIELYVARTVQQEIDRHKGGGNARRSDRARKASSLLRTVLDSPDNGYVYRPENPRVILKLAPRLDPLREKYESLDLTQPDDRLIEEVLYHKNSHADVRVALLTDDVPAMGTAREMGLEYVAIPEEWRLPPEPSPEAKEIAELRRRLTALEKVNPVLELKAINKDGVEIKKIEIDYVQYEPMTPSELSELMVEIDCIYPKQKDFSEPQNAQRGRGAISGYPGIFEKNVWREPSEGAISRYQDKYDEWLRDIKICLEDYHNYVNFQQSMENVRFSLFNSGSLPANDLLISFCCAGGILLDIDRKYKGEKNGGLKMPPEPPAGYYASVRELRAGAYAIDRMMTLPDSVLGRGLPSILARESLLRREPDDPYAFYYHPKHKKAFGEWELRCQQFRHQLEPQEFGWRLCISGNLTEGKGVIRVLVSASNVPTPVSLNLPVHIRKRNIPLREEGLAAIKAISWAPGADDTPDDYDE